MTTRKTVYDGRTKALYEGPTEDTLIQYFKDNIRLVDFINAKNDKKKKNNLPIVFGKGVLNNRISAYLMSKMDEIGIPTHFVKALNMREQLVWDIEILPFEVVIRNVAARDISERLGAEEGSYLPRPLMEITLKNEKRGNPHINRDHILTFGWADNDELEDIDIMAMRINDFLSGLFLGVGLKLIDARLEFGRLYYEGESFIILGDELSPDNCRLWLLNDKKELEKQSFGQDMNGLIDHYQEIAKRLGLLPEGKITQETTISQDFLVQTGNGDIKPFKPKPIRKS